MAALTAVDDATSRLHPVEPAQKPELKVLRRRRRWPILLGGLFVLLLLAAMLGAAIFHTQLAERQLEIDALGTRVQVEYDRHAKLRADIAAKSNPSVLEAAAAQLGLARAPQPRFLEVSGWALAIQFATAGPVQDGPGQVILGADALEQYREIKSLSVGQP